MKKVNFLKGKTFSILGDSYSTFLGFIPGSYMNYYPAPKSVVDVLHVEDTWWHRLADTTGMVLSVNDSYAGSTVCTNVREGYPSWNAYVHRAKMVDFSRNGSPPDYILVFGGTNDSLLEREVGEPVYEDFTEDQLRQVLPAFCNVIEKLGHRYPKVRLITVINTDLNPKISQGMHQIAVHYGTSVVVLENVEKQNRHPTARGMASIAQQVEAVLRSL